MTEESEVDVERLRVKAPVKKKDKRSNPFYPSIDQAWVKEMMSTLEDKGFHSTSTTFVAIQAIFRAYLEGGSKPSFSYSTAKVEQCYYIDKRSFRKVLGELQEAGLIELKSGQGQKPVITLLCTGVIK